MENYCLGNRYPKIFQDFAYCCYASGHPPFIGDLPSNIKVVFLPPNTTSLIQLMDHGVIAMVKAKYLRRTFAQAVAATKEYTEKTLM